MFFGAIYTDPSDGTPRRVLKRRMTKAELSLKAFATDTEWDQATACRALSGLTGLDINRLWKLAEVQPRFVRGYLDALRRALIDLEERHAEARYDERKSA